MLSPQAYQLLQLLADGEFHSGEDLGRVLGSTRASIWKYVQQLQELGLDVVSVRGRGYRLPQPLELLNPEFIRTNLDPKIADRFQLIDCHQSIESTNSELLSKVSLDGLSGAAVCIAEHQSKGKGRRGRQWQSPFASSVCFSMSWSFSQGLASLQGLSLAVGVAVARVLNKIAIENVQLKWPNDILITDKKLGGILIEVGGDVSGDCFAVIGIGINGDLSSGKFEKIDQPYTDLKSHDWDGQRNKLLVLLIENLVDTLDVFVSHGFAAFKEEWLSSAAFIDKTINLIQGEKIVTGQLKGVDDFGALLVEQDGELTSYSGGELSLRVAE